MSAITIPIITRKMTIAAIMIYVFVLSPLELVAGVGVVPGDGDDDEFDGAVGVVGAVGVAVGVVGAVGAVGVAAGASWLCALAMHVICWLTAFFAISIVFADAAMLTSWLQIEQIKVPRLGKIGVEGCTGVVLSRAKFIHIGSHPNR